jgi:hypothetical protein
MPRRRAGQKGGCLVQCHGLGQRLHLGCHGPLSRAVIGGLMRATVATLAFVPSLFALLHYRKSYPPP